jgi:cytochrome bd-type quinol oxidase subunit 1
VQSGLLVNLFQIPTSGFGFNWVSHFKVTGRYSRNLLAIGKTMAFFLHCQLMGVL